MGTSRSHPGPTGRTPLVPSWANEAAGDSGPTPPQTERRFTGFRTALGKFVGSGDRQALHSALRSYARTGSGGSRTAARRIAPASRAAGALFGAIGAAQGQPQPAVVLDVGALAGRPVDEAIEAILDALCPPGGPSDAEIVRAAMNEALAQMLAGQVAFDPAAITREDALVLMERYLTETLFCRIAIDGGKAFDRTADPVVQVQAEVELRSFIEASVGAHLPDVLPLNHDLFNATAIERAVDVLVERVWNDWQEL